MAIPQVLVEHKSTKARTFLPETALDVFPDYKPVKEQLTRDQVPDGDLTAPAASPAAATAAPAKEK